MFQKATLPISIDDGIQLKVEDAIKFGESLSADYCFAEPCSQVVFDEFLPVVLIDIMLNNFPIEKIEKDVFLR